MAAVVSCCAIWRASSGSRPAYSVRQSGLRVNLPELFYKFVDLQIRQPRVEHHRLRRRPIQTRQRLRAARGLPNLPSQIGQSVPHPLPE
jgi:hypothetical protein